MVRDLHQVLENVESKAEAVVDARGAARFAGKAPEPRKGVRGGHIPGSLNVPFDSVLENGRCLAPCFRRSHALRRWQMQPPPLRFGQDTWTIWTGWWEDRAFWLCGDPRWLRAAC